MFSILLAVACAAVVIYLGYRIVSRYREATGTAWERLLSAANDSATILVQKVILLGSFVDTAIVNGATALNLPEVTDFVQKYMPPQYLGWFMATAAVMTIVARLRTL